MFIYQAAQKVVYSVPITHISIFSNSQAAMKPLSNVLSFSALQHLSHLLGSPDTVRFQETVIFLVSIDVKDTFAFVKFSAWFSILE